MAKNMIFDENKERASNLTIKDQKILDGWSNVLSGFGYRMDKRKYTSFNTSLSTYLTADNLASMYSEDGLSKRIIDTMADDMTREWFSFTEENKNDESKESNQKILDKLEELEAETHINLAIKWARLFGGSLLFIGALDGQSPDKPLNRNKVKSIEYLEVFDLGDIETSSCIFDSDPKSETYGKILIFDVNTHIGTEWKELKLHRTRCIPFYGLKVPKSLKASTYLLERRHWGISVLQPAYEYLKDYIAAFANVSDIIYEFVIGKYKFSDLDEMLAQGNESLLQNRVEAIDMTKSIIHSVLLGTDEDYTRDVTSLTGIPDTLDRFMMNLSAVTEYPVSKLFGRSPAGLNATGENDLKNYYDSVHAKQKTQLTPGVQKLVNIISDYLNVTPFPKIKWNSLFQLTEEQQANHGRIIAETNRTQADADQRYIQEGVLMPEDIYKMRFEEQLGPREFDEYEDEPINLNMPNAPMANENVGKSNAEQ